MQVSNFVPTVNEAAATYKGKRKVNSVAKLKKKNRKIFPLVQDYRGHKRVMILKYSSFFDAFFFLRCVAIER